MREIYGKLLALTLLATLLAAAWGLIGEPYVDLWQDRVAQAERIARKQLALRQLIANGEGFDQQYRALSDSEGLNQAYLDEKNGALAEIKLRRIVEQIVTDNGASVIQVAIRKKPATAGAKPDAFSEPDADKSVKVQVVMRGSLDQIYSALQALENSRPLILVDNLEITHVKTRYQVARSTEPLDVYSASYDATAFIL